MSDTTEQPDEMPEQRDEAVAAALLAGLSVNATRKRFGLSIDELDAIIARQWPVDNRARLRMIMTDCGKLDRLISEFFRRSLMSQDATSAAFATVAIKAMERKHSLVGADAVQRIDLQVTQLEEAPSSYEKLTAAIMTLTNRSGARAVEPPPDATNGGPSDQ